MGKKSLEVAKKTKYDEFYTRLSDIHGELQHYPTQFRDKVVYCNCDNPEQSKFWEFFCIKFHEWGLKKLIATYKGGQYKYETVNGSLGIEKILIGGDGDFRSRQCISILKEADIIVTNPPFSLCREYIAQLMRYRKKFLILMPMTAIGYKEIFPLFRNNLIHLGVTPLNKTMYLTVNSSYSKIYTIIDGEPAVKFSSLCWGTNLEHNSRPKPMILSCKYFGNEEKYPKYNNYDGININKLSEIPCDFYGVMGVSITFLGKYCPEQFEIVGFRKGDDGKDLKYGNTYPFPRILIRRKV